MTSLGSLFRVEQQPQKLGCHSWQFDGWCHKTVGAGRTECSSTRQIVDSDERTNVMRCLAVPCNTLFVRTASLYCVLCGTRKSDECISYVSYVIADGRSALAPHSGPSGVGASGKPEVRPAHHSHSPVGNVLVRPPTLWRVADGTARRIWRNWRSEAKHRYTMRCTHWTIKTWHFIFDYNFG